MLFHFFSKTQCSWIYSIMHNAAASINLSGFLLSNINNVDTRILPSEAKFSCAVLYCRVKEFVHAVQFLSKTQWRINVDFFVWSVSTNSEGITCEKHFVSVALWDNIKNVLWFQMSLASMGFFFPFWRKKSPIDNKIKR